MLDAGRLRHRVTLQRRSTTAAPDAYGQPSQVWDDVDTVYAEVLPVSGGEQTIGGGVTAVPAFKVTIRFYDGLTTAWRLLFKGRPMEIVSAENTEEIDVEQVLSCREVL